MQTKKLAILGVAAAVALIGAGIALTNRDDQTASVVREVVLFPDLTKRANDIAVVAITGRGNQIDLTRTGADAWVLAEKGGYPVATDKIAKLVFGLADLKTVEARTDKPENYDKLGVGDATKKDGDAKLVALKDATGKDIATVIVGKVPAGDGIGSSAGGVYVRKPKDAQSWLATGKVTVETDPLRWIDRELTRIKKDQVLDIDLNGPKGPVKLVRVDPAKPDFTVVGAAADKLDAYAVNRTASVLEFLDLDDVKKAADVDFSNAVRAVYRTLDKIEVDIDMVRQGDQTWARLSATRPADAPKDDAAQAAVDALNKRLSGWAYKLGNSDAEALNRDQAAFMKKEDAAKTQ